VLPGAHLHLVENEMRTRPSNMSKIFWPPQTKGNKGEQRRLRGEILREKLGLPDQGHFLCDRNIRNHLEHYDERLDDWRENSPERHILSDMIGPPSAIGGIDPQNMMRGYAPSTHSFNFRGESYDIQQLADTIVLINEQISDFESERSNHR
ncbi:hypothetical protein ACT3TC_08295, partial [Halomonas sp. AOP27-A1-41]|uniref:hypothetical protein n=1 Tax=Halomonas sp. AOP27-A1-41 TaxID=3457707 RepID=UPI0040336662